MNEIQALLEAFASVKRDSARAALATIVKVRGSAYRRPGARMLIAPDGRTVGSISAGCLDRDATDQFTIGWTQESLPLIRWVETRAPRRRRGRATELEAGREDIEACPPSRS